MLFDQNDDISVGEYELSAVELSFSEAVVDMSGGEGSCI